MRVRRITEVIASGMGAHIPQTFFLMLKSSGSFTRSRSMKDREAAHKKYLSLKVLPNYAFYIFPTISFIT